MPYLPLDVTTSLLAASLAAIPIPGGNPISYALLVILAYWTLKYSARFMPGRRLRVLKDAVERAYASLRHAQSICIFDQAALAYENTRLLRAEHRKVGLEQDLRDLRRCSWIEYLPAAYHLHLVANEEKRKLARAANDAKQDYATLSSGRGAGHAVSLLRPPLLRVRRNPKQQHPNPSSSKIPPTHNLQLPSEAKADVLLSSPDAGANGEERTKSDSDSDEDVPCDASHVSVQDWDCPPPTLFLAHSPYAPTDEDMTLCSFIHTHIPVYMKLKYEADEKLATHQFRMDDRPGRLTDNDGDREYLEDAVQVDSDCFLLYFLLDRPDAAGFAIDMVSRER
ncbi:hypothetical protein C8F01DRAFT_1258888 [Mycena amicta]|nr:hypothetical protein C8F01DRAFT_1258888 [Mycena amicta]